MPILQNAVKVKILGRTCTIKTDENEDYVKEIADVYIMVQQLIYMHSDIFPAMYEEKLAKVRKKLMTTEK